MDSGEVTEIKRHFDVVSDGFRTEVADVKRHFNVVAEGLRSEIRLVADGLAGLGERMDRRFEDVERRMNEQFEETRAMIRLSYTELDRRLRTLEGRQDALESRLERLETR